LLETVPLLDLARRNSLDDADLYQSLRDQVESISKMTTGLIKGTAQRTK